VEKAVVQGFERRLAEDAPVVRQILEGERVLLGQADEDFGADGIEDFVGEHGKIASLFRGQKRPKFESFSLKTKIPQTLERCSFAGFFPHLEKQQRVLYLPLPKRLFSVSETLERQGFQGW
jgi:hypothetical protein